MSAEVEVAAAASPAVENISDDDVANGIDASNMLDSGSEGREETITMSKEGIKADDNFDKDHNDTYKYLVVDSGPIIRHTGLSTLWKKAQYFYTVPAVLQEIRDEKARQHLEMLPFELIARQPTPESVKIMSDFARKTGDYQSLSSVDLQVLGLLYDLEKEASPNGCVDHVRTEPKRTVGLGKIELLSSKTTAINEDGDNVVVQKSEPKQTPPEDDPSSTHPRQQDDRQGGQSTGEEITKNNSTSYTIPPIQNSTSKTRTWASLVSTEASKTATDLVKVPVVTKSIADQNLSIPFGKMNLSPNVTTSAVQNINLRQKTENDNVQGQFSDAEDDPLDENYEHDDESECNELDLEAELALDFPSLAASALVPYEGSDDEGSIKDNVEAAKSLIQLSLDERKRLEEERKQKSLRPISKSGKLYNSFSKYGDLMKPKPVSVESKKHGNTTGTTSATDANPAGNDERRDEYTSRIVGGAGFSGQDDNVEDDGEGWITTTKDINILKASGVLDPSRNPIHGNGNSNNQLRGPPFSQRAACATTDFAMQNVILQMNLELLSVDGMRVQKLKNWVTRCGACFKVYTNNEYRIGGLGSKRLFCSHCGSDFMQRIAASVDGKTGRLRLHLSKKHKTNLRGTKYSLPKPGTANRFQGDLLLREDQLLTGAWNQKVKMRSGGKAKSAAESMFGNDIATNVGCHTNSLTCDDIRVGFGRRNPNAAKGRERRGKKKKTTDKACGLRRY